MGMKNWNTDVIMQLLAGLPAEVGVQGPGGDFDTQEIVLTATGAGKDERLFLGGFVTDGRSIEDPEDTEVEMLYLNDGQDSRGGLSSGDPPTCRLYAEVMIRMRAAGFSVVPSMDEYF